MLRPTPEPTLPPTPQPTIRPTPEPTLPPTPEPTARPTPEPTVRPTPEPTLQPTPEPALTPTALPTALAERTAAPRAVASSPASGTAAAAKLAAPRSPAPARAAVAATAAPVAAPVRTAPLAAAATASPAAPGLASLNDRLRAALPTKPTAGMQRVDLGSGYSANRVLDAYEAALAPSLAILAKTFGIIYTTRTITHADSVAYVYERTHLLLGGDVCRAYRITEHPLRPVDAAPDETKPGAVSFPAPLRDQKPEIETVELPCDAPGMIKVAPGSLTTPVPRRPAPPPRP
jgi:hypothetical protein